MRKNILEKNLVWLIAIIFIGASFIPSINGQENIIPQNNDNISIVTFSDKGFSTSVTKSA